MDTGRCRHCGRPFTAGEVTGLGILRARPAAQGGPRIEFPCPGCRTVNRLVPHGNGRYAPPGQAPPPPPSEQERRVPWHRETVEADGASTEAPPPTPPEPAPGPAKARASGPDAPEEVVVDAGPMRVPVAAELLGVAEDASPAAIELAFRERALLCHPDKVSHLDPEFVALAERKFRRLQDARDLLLLRAGRNLLGEPS
jgi:hypothetical protein